MRASVKVLDPRYRDAPESASGQDKRKRREPGVEQRRKLGEAARITIGIGFLGAFEIAPALVRALRVGRDQLQLGRQHDIDSAILALFEPENFLAADEPVLDDPVD